MHKIHGYNAEKCLMCGNDTFTKADFELEGNEMKSKVCDKCYCIYITEQEEIYFAGFITKEEYLFLLTKKHPVLRAAPKKPINPIAN